MKQEVIAPHHNLARLEVSIIYAQPARPRRERSVFPAFVSLTVPSQSGEFFFMGALILSFEALSRLALGALLRCYCFLNVTCSF